MHGFRYYPKWGMLKWHDLPQVDQNAFVSFHRIQPPFARRVLTTRTCWWLLGGVTSKQLHNQPEAAVTTSYTEEEPTRQAGPSPLRTGETHAPSNLTGKLSLTAASPLRARRRSAAYDFPDRPAPPAGTPAPSGGPYRRRRPAACGSLCTPGNCGRAPA